MIPIAAESDAISDKLIHLIELALSYVIYDAKNDGMWGKLIAAALLMIGVLAVALLVFKAVKSCIEGVAKLFELYKNSGLPMTLNWQKKKNLRKRKQFCTVL